MTTPDSRGEAMEAAKALREQIRSRQCPESELDSLDAYDAAVAQLRARLDAAEAERDELRRLVVDLFAAHDEWLSSCAVSAVTPGRHERRSVAARRHRDAEDSLRAFLSRRGAGDGGAE